MVLDRLDQSAAYESLNPRLSKAFAFLRTFDLLRAEPGRHEIDGDDVFALLQEYKTKPETEGIWESHRRYMDVQYVIAGVERMGYANVRSLAPRDEYNAERDLIFHDGEGSFVTVQAGMFTIFAPQDGHMPCLAAGEPALVRKVVIKVAM
ncbi:MAG TPA: YhcH/YjgK/YiaL family protein [Pirellulales bacterium]|jgi:YhcH/YjgK/YiaL family protein